MRSQRLSPLPYKTQHQISRHRQIHTHTHTRRVHKPTHTQPMHMHKSVIAFDKAVGRCTFCVVKIIWAKLLQQAVLFRSTTWTPWQHAVAQRGWTQNRGILTTRQKQRADEFCPRRRRGRQPTVNAVIMGRKQEDVRRVNEVVWWEDKHQRQVMRQQSGRLLLAASGQTGEEMCITHLYCIRMTKG